MFALGFREALAALLVSLGMLCTPAAGQGDISSVSELRRENDELRQRIDQLEAQLRASSELIEKLRGEIAGLTQQVKALRSELANAGASGGGPGGSGDATDPDTMLPEPRFAPIPQDKPFSSPEALLLETMASFEDQVGPVRDREGVTDEELQKEIESWIRAVRRDMRSQIDWTIQIVGTETNGRTMTIEYRVLDPVTGKPYSERTSTAQISTRIARRILTEPATEYWQLVGTAGAAPSLNVERTQRGFFDFPPYIGRFTEFDFELNVQSLLPTTLKKPDGSDESPDENGTAADAPPPVSR